MYRSLNIDNPSSYSSFPEITQTNASGTKTFTFTSNEEYELYQKNKMKVIRKQHMLMDWYVYLFIRLLR
jgi:hypothetical protein